MYCSYCGKQISDDTAFCSHCGKQIRVVSQNAPSRSSPPTSSETFLERRNREKFGETEESMTQAYRDERAKWLAETDKNKQFEHLDTMGLIQRLFEEKFKKIPRF